MRKVYVLMSGLIQKKRHVAGLASGLDLRPSTCTFGMPASPLLRSHLEGKRRRKSSGSKPIAEQVHTTLIYAPPDCLEGLLWLDVGESSVASRADLASTCSI